MATPIIKIKGIGLRTAEILVEHGFKSAEDLAATTEDALGKVHGFGPARARMVIEAARVLCDASSENTAVSPGPAVEIETTEFPLVDDDTMTGDSTVIRRLEKKDTSKKKGKEGKKKKKNKGDKKSKKEEKLKSAQKIEKSAAKKKKKKKKKKKSK